MSVSVGVLTRIYIGELPYLKCFIDHYLGLGVACFYFVVPEPDDISHLNDVLAPYRGAFELIVDEEIRDPEKALRIEIARMKTDYVVSIDVDELIYVSGTQNLPHFLESRGVATANMRWIMSPRDFTPQEGRIRGFKG